MKKLSILILLMICVTITGVYATWSYAGTDDIADAYAEAKVTITDAVLTGANGVYKVDSNLTLTVDQANEDHEAKLVFASNDGEDIFLKVTFTPATNAPQDIKDNAVPSELIFSTSSNMQYSIDSNGNYSATGTPVDIFTFVDQTVTWNPESDGSFTYTLDENDLKSMISLSRTFVLDLKSEHEAFRTALNGNIVAKVTDGKTT